MHTAPMGALRGEGGWGGSHASWFIAQQQQQHGLQAHCTARTVPGAAACHAQPPTATGHKRHLQHMALALGEQCRGGGPNDQGPAAVATAGNAVRPHAICQLATACAALPCAALPYRRRAAAGGGLGGGRAGGDGPQARGRGGGGGQEAGRVRGRAQGKGAEDAAGARAVPRSCSGCAKIRSSSVHCPVHHTGGSSTYY